MSPAEIAGGMDGLRLLVEDVIDAVLSPSNGDALTSDLFTFDCMTAPNAQFRTDLRVPNALRNRQPARHLFVLYRHLARGENRAVFIDESSREVRIYAGDPHVAKYAESYLREKLPRYTFQIIPAALPVVVGKRKSYVAGEVAPDTRPSEKAVAIAENVLKAGHLRKRVIGGVVYGWLRDSRVSGSKIQTDKFYRSMVRFPEDQTIYTQLLRIFRPMRETLHPTRVTWDSRGLTAESAWIDWMRAACVGAGAFEVAQRRINQRLAELSAPVREEEHEPVIF